MGKVLAPNLVESNMQFKIRKNRKLDAMSTIAWKQKIALDNNAYVQFIKGISLDWEASLAEIDADTDFLLGLIKKIDAGVSKVDASLLANARWIRGRSPFEPLVLTDDGDLLSSAHMLSSFFGISLGFLSTFEALRLAKIESPLSECCRYFGIKGGFGSLTNAWTKQALESSLSTFLKKGKITCHPNKRVMALFKSNHSTERASYNE